MNNYNQFRISIPRWNKNMLVTAAIKSLQMFLTPDTMQFIRIILIKLHNKRKIALKMNNNKNENKMSENDILWKEFCQTMLFLIEQSKNNGYRLNNEQMKQNNDKIEKVKKYQIGNLYYNQNFMKICVKMIHF